MHFCAHFNFYTICHVQIQMNTEMWIPKLFIDSQSKVTEEELISQKYETLWSGVVQFFKVEHNGPVRNETAGYLTVKTVSLFSTRQEDNDLVHCISNTPPLCR